MLDLERGRDDHSTSGWELINVGELGQSVLASPMHRKVIRKRWLSNRPHRRFIAPLAAAIEVPERATISNKTLSELELSSSLNILGLVRGEERFFNLTGSSQFEGGDILIVLGPRQELNRLGNILAA